MGATAFSSNDAGDYIALAPQAAVGAAPASTAAYVFAKWIDGTTGVDHDRAVTFEREGGDGQDNGLAYVEHHVANTQLAAYARPEVSARWLGWALGAGTVAGSAGVGYVHTLTPAIQARLLTAEVAAPAQSIIEQLIDSKIGELTIEGEHGKPIKLTAKVTGGDSPRKLNAASARVVTVETGEPFYFNLGSIAFGVEGPQVAEDEVTKFSLTWSREQDDSVYGVGYGRKAITDLNRTVSLEMTHRYTSATMHAGIMYQGGMTGSIIDPTVATGVFDAVFSNGLTGASARSLRLVVPNVAWRPLTRNTFEPDGKTVYEDLAGVGLRQGTHVFYAEVRNMVATAIASGLL